MASQRADFAFEITLASRTFAPWISELIRAGYTFHLVFLWLPNSEMAVARVAERVRLGGHDVPEETIRRRYHAGLVNFFRLYRPLATTWRFYDNSFSPEPRLLAAGHRNATESVTDCETWKRVATGFKHG